MRLQDTKELQGLTEEKIESDSISNVVLYNSFSSHHSTMEDHIAIDEQCTFTQPPREATCKYGAKFSYSRISRCHEQKGGYIKVYH
jgi:hypothetical protein